ncbi:MAG: formylglycine-generating enzyme family protein [Acidobacteria bacterium]|jgi:formylglycine-generating enzyme|nr:formylglycine-generating enzyme family protein [Acidobacteriota bacterium]
MRVGILGGWLAGALAVGSCATGPSAPQAQWTDPITGMVFVQVPAGQFVMGSPPGEYMREVQEVQHGVTVPEPFWLGAVEVTHAQWTMVMSDNPGEFAGQGETLPVESISWFQPHEFLGRLTERSSGNRFRLPTEAEWKYACRAGTTSSYATGDTLNPHQANFDATPATTGEGKPTPVGSFAPNAWGLFDMHGNLWEWTADEHCPYPSEVGVDAVASCGSPLKVIRGGSWYFGDDSARCALRYTHEPQDVGPSLGFRVVRERAIR